MNVNPLPMLDQVGLSVCWPELMATCERLRVPALRVDKAGRAHLLRTVADLATWREAGE